MGWFPMFTDLSGRECVVVGGGTVALRKVGKLLPYGPRITVIAPRIRPELRTMAGVSCVEEPFDETRIPAGCACVIAASDSREANHAAAAYCRLHGIPVNTADCPEECTFLFPALVTRGQLTVGISTGGASPVAASCLREQIESILPENTEELLNFLETLRPLLRQRLSAPELRTAVNRAAFTACLSCGRPLTEEELENLITEKTRLFGSAERISCKETIHS